MKRTSFARSQIGTNVRWLLIVLFSVASAGAQQDPAAFFRQNCASCHTVGGGRLTGPDLKDVGQRKDRAWLTQWVQNPKAVIDSGDPYAAKLLQDARGVLMPAVNGMSPAMATALLDLIDVESKLPRSQFAGSQISDRPFTPQDIANGRAIFTGATRLTGGGPPCISCHTMKGLGGLSGGRLGPDLTLVYERLQGRKGLGAWLTSPQSPTMAPVFRASAMKPEEILPLLALFEDSAKRGGQDDAAATMNFFLISLGAMVVGLVSLDAMWKKRLRGVRRGLREKRGKA
ncbi:MAG TPA: cytochrome c [Terriglobales bacterium]|nr:cytochrome c [Terriglobales bacterium]